MPVTLNKPGYWLDMGLEQLLNNSDKSVPTIVDDAKENTFVPGIMAKKYKSNNDWGNAQSQYDEIMRLYPYWMKRGDTIPQAQDRGAPRTDELMKLLLDYSR